MKSFNPTSNIYLTNVPWTDTYKDILNFSNINQQTEFFNSRIRKTFSNYVYLKKDSAIKVEGNIDELIMYNYLFYKNPTTNKYYYCFITNMEYISENTTQIYFKTDVFQTWGFDIVYNKCFVERCHVTNDSVGANTVPEGLETGEYISNYQTSQSLGTLYYVLGSTANPLEEGYPNEFGGVYNGIYSGVTYFYYSNGYTENLQNDLQSLANANKISAVTSLFMAPKWLCGNSTISGKGKIETSTTPLTYDNLQLQRITNLNGYTPRNNKLLTYPYCYFLASNGVGASCIWRQEFFSENIPKIMTEGCLTPSCSIHYTPLNYKGLGQNWDEGLSGGKLPQCNWATDQFTNWLTQNSVNLTIPDVQMAQTPLTMFDELKSLNIGGAISSYTNSYLSVLQRDKEVETHAKIPPQVAGNLNSGDIATASGDNRLNVKGMTIKAEFARIIDDYFDMFGYQVNRVQQLTINGRPNWNYIKTINCNISGNIPESDLNEYRQIFDSGVTCWHNINTMYDYTQNNK